MATQTYRRYFCDWCETEMFDSGVTTVFSGKITHWENGPDKWSDEEVCHACDAEFKKLRHTRQSGKGE